MSINSISPDQAVDPRSTYLAALSVAEQIIAAAPVVPQSVTASRFDGSLDLHLAGPAAVVVFARWIGAHVTTSRTESRYPFLTSTDGTWHGVRFNAWAMHSDAEWVQRQQDKAGELAAQAHDMYDLNADSAHVVPGCAPYGCLAAPVVGEVSA